LLKSQNNKLFLILKLSFFHASSLVTPSLYQLGEENEPRYVGVVMTFAPIPKLKSPHLLIIFFVESKLFQRSSIHSITPFSSTHHEQQVF
ncbi:hypothetical protein, partial [Enterococcus faecium]|uniref:hypothetical protein n=1 Tax=Enterococcus faecium TaxID=1352 RepID=UPI0034E986EC